MVLRKRGLLISIIALLLIEGSAHAVGQWERVSVINLIANPDNYHGKLIQIQGYMVIERENTAIYLSEADAKHHITKNAIWLSFNGREYEKHVKNNRTYVFVDGKFDGDHATGRNFSGAITEISRIFRYPHK